MILFQSSGTVLLPYSKSFLPIGTDNFKVLSWHFQLLQELRSSEYLINSWSPWDNRKCCNLLRYHIHFLTICLISNLTVYLSCSQRAIGHRQPLSWLYWSGHTNTLCSRPWQRQVRQGMRVFGSWNAGWHHTRIDWCRSSIDNTSVHW